ncbi:alkaline phosphatase-like protein [Thozetella sp. PMI_491]|nr:alkaline phosphatase-like protein [Thozetella sp. PMI_491]
MASRREGSFLSTALLVVANALVPAAILTFATGFFPYKPFLPGLAQYDAVTGYGPPVPAKFDKLVFMLVDALRSDFVYSANSGFSFTQSLIRDGAALPFTAHATSPTVTMPRLKAITTGSIPSFLDVILNLDETDETSTLASQDTWLAQMKAKGTGQLLLYGDDTWLKLFPDTFDRADGTTSFFVADFTEVDNNVTRHVADELRNDDWNTMVLHYLGLDHIGHKGGPRSSNMIPKQHEMDGIVKQIYSALESEKHLQDTLFVLIGDHGMNDAGNHGASSPGETSPALVFMSPKLKGVLEPLNAPLPEAEDFQYYSTIEQSDLAPTLGALLGFPAPKNNLGALIAEFLPFWPDKKQQAQILMRNAHQILGIVTAAFGEELFLESAGDDVCSNIGSDIQELACEWRGIRATAKTILSADELDPQWAQATIKWLRKAQGLMSNMASNYDMPRLFFGQGIALAAIICAMIGTYLSTPDSAASFLPFAVITVAYGIMMFASSYVEEEHHFWYWTTAGWLGLITFRGFNGKISSRTSHIQAAVLAAATFRVVRGWNQTGQKFAGEPDIVKIFLHAEPVVLWILVSATYLWIHREVVHGFSGLMTAINVAGSTGLVLAAYTFKLAFTNEDAPELVVGFAKNIAEVTAGPSLLSRARAVFIGLSLATLIILYFIFTKNRVSIKSSAINTLHHVYTLLAVTQSRATNIPLFLLFNILLKFIESQDLSLVELSTTSLLLQFASFFAFGGSNAISSVDLSSAYNGIANFNVGAVGVLTFISNWAAPIYWVSATNLLLVRKHKAGQRGVFKAHVAVLTVFAAASVAAVMVACTVLRTHLFIWTVFSPKYLYSMGWTLGQHLLVNVGVGGLLFWLGLSQ